MHKDQPRPHGADSEARIPALSTKEGCRGGQLLHVDPNHSYSCSAFLVLREIELQLPGSSSASHHPSRAPPPDRLVFKSRMARPRTERGGGVDAQVIGRGGRTRPPQLEDATPRSGIPSGFLCLGGAHPTLPASLDLLTRGGELICPWLFPAIGRRVPAGIGAPAGFAQPREARSCVRGWLSLSEEAEYPHRGPRSASHPRKSCACPVGPGKVAFGSPSW